MNELQVTQDTGKDEKERIWSLGIKAQPVFLSQREEVILKAYMKRGSYRDAYEAYVVSFPKTKNKVGESTVKRWLNRDHVKKEFFERIKTEAISNKYLGEDGKKNWLRDMIEYREGIKKLEKGTLVIMDLIGKYMGYAKELGSVSIGRQQINFYQSDGSR